MADPLNLAELDPNEIQSKIDARDNKPRKPPTELELQKEARLTEREKRLAADKHKKTTPTSQIPAAAPPPPKLDRSVLLDKIAAYRDRFPSLKKRNNVSAKSTYEEIEDELHYIELQLGSQGGGQSFGATIMYGGMVCLEKFTHEYWNPLGLNLTGLGAITQQNMDQFQPIIDELMIKHNAGMYTSPEWRLALAIGATVITVNAANSNPEMARAVKGMNQAVSVPSNSNDL